ncbi:MAG: hypothetical protein ABIQ65_02910 [Thermoanaerobaculia bacterium]
MFCDETSVGAFSVSPQALARGDGEALFRILVATAMFQRRQDQQILRILRGIDPATAAELTEPAQLLKLVRRSTCPNIKSVELLRQSCDLTKDPRTRQGTCSARPSLECHLKDHTVVLKRYGHFGKMPTSLALAISEEAVADLPALLRRIVATNSTRMARAVALEGALCAAWRINQKLASMFLSAVTNPDLSPGFRPPWGQGLDWTYFVVVDSNVDGFLAAIGYAGPGSYDARRIFLRGLAARIDLSSLKRGLRAFNPRLVQQAMYLFMSATNRRALPNDCGHLGPATCTRCPQALAARCSVRHRAAA